MEMTLKKTGAVTDFFYSKTYLKKAFNVNVKNINLTVGCKNLLTFFLGKFSLLTLKPIYKKSILITLNRYIVLFYG